MARKFNALAFSKRFAKRLGGQFKIDRLILFGSATNGKMDYHSDIDLILISRDFENINFIKRLQMLQLAREGEFRKVPMDLWAYTPTEFSKISKKSVVLSEAKEKGREVKI